jgi:hypothetical protein
VKYVGEEHAQHLIQTLKRDYTISTNWTGKRYSGIALDWDYNNPKLHLSMPGYCSEVLVIY